MLAEHKAVFSIHDVTQTESEGNQIQESNTSSTCRKQFQHHPENNKGYILCEEASTARLSHRQ